MIINLVGAETSPTYHKKYDIEKMVKGYKGVTNGNGS